MQDAALDCVMKFASRHVKFVMNSFTFANESLFGQVSNPGSFMQSIKIEKDNQVGFEEILKGIRQLDDQALTQVAGEVTRLLSKRGAKTVVGRENELLRKIKAVIPSRIRRRQKQLYARLQQEALMPKEHEELLLLNNLLEEKSAERILLMGELAKLRGVSVQQLIAEFKTA